MGLIKRMSRKLFAKIVPIGHNSNQLVLNTSIQPNDHLAQVVSSKTSKALNKLSRKSRNNSAVTEALLLAAKNHLPPVQFHHVHGPNAQLSHNKCVARRTQSFCQALVFSSRVILPNERVYIKVLDIAKGWSGTIRFGFTSVDPATLACSMPKHACPDMTNAGHTWARALADEVVRKNSVIHFSYNTNGYIYYGINNQDCGIYHANVNTNQNLWFIVDIYGITAAVELIDPRVHNATSEIDFAQIDDQIGLGDRSTMYKSTSAMDDIFGINRSAASVNKSKKRRTRKSPSSTRHTAIVAGHWSRGERIIGDPFDMRFMAHQQLGAELSNLNSIISPSAQQNIYSPMPNVSHLAAAEFQPRNESHDYLQITGRSHTRESSRPNSSARLVPATASTVPVAHRTRSSKAHISPSSSSSSPAQSTPLAAKAPVNSQTHPKPRTRHSIKAQKSTTTTPTTAVATSTTRDSIDKNNNNNPQGKDCPICFERPINCVLYQCGHMCTCYECGVKQWKTQSRTCPICRTIIKDVIKTYLS